MMSELSSIFLVLLAFLLYPLRLADNCKLVVAGPFDNGGTYRGLFILNVTTFEDAKALLETDAAIKEKYL